jgi:hypothetical protein
MKTFTVSENVQIKLNGELYLLESGDMISISSNTIEMAVINSQVVEALLDIHKLMQTDMRQARIDFKELAMNKKYASVFRPVKSAAKHAYLAIKSGDLNKSDDALSNLLNELYGIKSKNQ